MAALLPVAQHARRSGAPPPSPPGRHGIFWLILEAASRKTSLGRRVKRVFQYKSPALRCWPSNSAVCDTSVRSDRIVFDSRPRIARANRETPKGNRGKKKTTLRHPARGGSRARDSEKVATQVTQEVESARAKPCPETRGGARARKPR